VAGEPGIGKTTLVEEFLGELKGGEYACMTARGRCSERLAGTEAYLPLLEVLEILMHAEASVAGMMRRLAPTWYVQVAPAVSVDEPLRMQTQGATQERRKRELASFLQELALQRLLVFFIDDLHWSDAATIDMLAYLAGKFDSLPVLIMATYRPAELALSEHPFAKLRSDLQARGLCRELSLGFLSLGEIEAYLSLKYPGHAFPPAFARMIHARTEGSPLFMTELVRYLRNRDVIVKEKDHWTLTHSVEDIHLELPESVQGMIRRKIEQVSMDDRRLLVAASVQGYEFDSAVVSNVLAMDAEEIEERLKVLDRDHRFVQLIEEEEFPDLTLTLHYRFVHVLYQNELYGSLTRTKRVRFSKEVAEALLNHYGEQSGTIASELAVLFESGRDFTRAVTYFILASQNAFKVCAYQEAILLIHRGLELLKNLSDTAERVRCELDMQSALGAALMATKGFAAPEVEIVCSRARQLAQQLGETPQLLKALLGLWSYYGTRAEHITARELGEQLLYLAQSEGDPVLLVLAHFSQGFTSWCLGDLVSSRAHFEQGIALYDPQQHGSLTLSGAEDTGTSCMGHLARVLCLLGYPELALKRCEEALALAQELSHPYTQAWTLCATAMVHQSRREAEKAQSGQLQPLLSAPIKDFHSTWRLQPSCVVGHWPNKGR
jgi:predicted ATPase